MSKNEDFRVYPDEVALPSSGAISPRKFNSTLEGPGDATGNPLLTIIIVNFNSSDFLCLSLEAIHRLTLNPYKVLICDNGSDPSDFQRIRYFCSFFTNVTLIARTQSSAGSMGHGEALNILAQFIDTPYGVVLDADCLPLMEGWDRFLIDQINDSTKIVGTPIARNSPNNKKPVDFPLMFLCLFETAIFRRLSIDFRPKDISRQQDTGWELREKFLAAGFSGKNLWGENTRTWKNGPFQSNICDEYYTDQTRTRLICSHLGRGSNPVSSKYSRSRRRGKKEYERDKKAWLATCEKIIDAEIRAIAKRKESPLEVAECDICGPGSTTHVLSGMDLVNGMPGVWDVVRCDNCGLSFTNPRPTPSSIKNFYPATYPCYLPQVTGRRQVNGFRQKVQRQLLRQHLGYRSDILRPSLFWKLLTRPLSRRLDVSLMPRLPLDKSVTPALLEVGCSTGVRLLELRAIGWDVRGIELSEVAARQAREAGLEVRTSPIEEVEFAPETFDCIILSMVLEHLHSPKTIISILTRWLKPGGELLISVPDASGLEARLFGPFHYGLQVPTHLYHFTPSTLGRLLGDFHYRIVHEGFHRDLKSGLENYIRAHPTSRFRPLLRIPQRVIKVIALALAFFGKSSRMQVRAVKRVIATLP